MLPIVICGMMENKKEIVYTKPMQITLFEENEDGSLVINNFT
jgi:hypothetical protein